MININNPNLTIIEKTENIGQLSRRLEFVESEVDRIRASIDPEDASEAALQKNIQSYQELIELIKEAAEIMLSLLDYMPGPALKADQDTPGAMTIYQN
jgi:hypothetical protein